MEIELTRREVATDEPIATQERLPMPTVFEGSPKRSLGAFYTPATAAEAMVDWLLRRSDDTILEPCFGDGVFLRAISTVSTARQVPNVNVFGVEISDTSFGAAVSRSLIHAANAFHTDFLSLSPFPVDAVVGNPPYVRLRHLPEAQRRLAQQIAERFLARSMDPGGSLWMPFVIHALRFLRRGGRLALVLPFDLTYVRYARQLWTLLANSFGDLRIIRVSERIFPEILQEVVILYGDAFGSRTSVVRLEMYARVTDIVAGKPQSTRVLDIRQIVRGERVFTQALLPTKLTDLLSSKIRDLTLPIREYVRFNIGYVSGDKNFFHPDPAAIQKYRIPSSSLLPSLASSRRLRGAGVRTGEICRDKADLLYLPAARPILLTQGEREYHRFGESIGVNLRHKCMVRSPWYCVPGVKIPDLVLSVFSEYPLLLLNDGKFVASNSLLCGYLHSSNAETLTACWYTSLVRLQCELEIHSLGGGVMVLVPREVGSVRVPEVRLIDGVSHALLPSVHERLRLSQVEEAYSLGDDQLLRSALGLTDDEIDLIKEGIAILRRWRTAGH